MIGGVGSTSKGERFTFDHDLPNETAYAETCANISLMFFAHRMLQVERDGEYGDVMERALYNGILSGVSLDGTRFFYANHLTVFPEVEPERSHCASTRQEWFGCACCPPNIARLLASLPSYMYSASPRALWVHLYGPSEATFEVHGAKVRVVQKTDYPWKEKVRFTVRPSDPVEFSLELRIPGWCRKPSLKVNGQSMSLGRITKKGYARIERLWEKGDQVDLTLPMPVERVVANPKVRMDNGRVALQRGPVVYCLEEADNGKDLAALSLPRDAKLKAKFEKDLLGGVVTISARGTRRVAKGWRDDLYRFADADRTEKATLKAVPYYAWDNRKEGEMMVWVREG